MKTTPYFFNEINSETKKQHLHSTKGTKPASIHTQEHHSLSLIHVFLCMLKHSKEASMAANKFATMLHKNYPILIVILVYAFLEWILILLLLLNSLFSHLIAKFVEFFGLKPSCPWCSTLDHHFDHVCEAHGTEISKMTFCSAHNKLAADSHSLCIRCSSSTSPNFGTMNDVSSTLAFFTWRSENAGDGEARCSCCDDQILTTKVYPDQSIPFKPTWDLLLEYVHKHKLGSQVKKDTEFQENGRDDYDGIDQKKIEGGKKAEDSNVEVEEWDSSHTIDEPFSLGRNEDEESEFIEDMLLQNAELMDSDRFICIELIDTDTDAAVAPTPTNSSEDVDDSDNRFEALQFDDTVKNSSRPTQDMTKIDGAELEQEIGLIESNNIEHLNRYESHTIEALYAELEEEREAAAEAAKESMAMITKLQEEKAAMQMEAVQYQRMMEEQAEYDQEALQLLNDLITKRDKENKQLHEELQMYKLTPTRSIDLEHEMGDVSLVEFDEERASILEQVKVLCDDGDHPMAKKLLPLFDGAEDEEEMVLMEEEVEHVYERLQALEADSDFLKHCIRSMSKGNEGMALLQEIKQHLRDLKSVQTNLL